MNKKSAVRWSFLSVLVGLLAALPSFLLILYTDGRPYLGVAVLLFVLVAVQLSLAVAAFIQIRVFHDQEKPSSPLEMFWMLVVAAAFILLLSAQIVTFHIAWTPL